MYPEIFSVGNFTVYSYGLFMVLALLTGYFFLLKTAELRSISRDFTGYLFGGAVIWGLIGARLFYVLIDIGFFISNPLNIFSVWGGGLVFSGAFLGGLAWVCYASFKRKVNFLDIGDTAVPALSLGYGVARLGCFMAGCCYGVPADSACGVVFPRGSYIHHDHIREGLITAAESPLPVYPVEIFSLLASVTMAYILYRALKSPSMKRGSVFALYLVFYGAFRVAIEFLRGDFRGGYLLFFTPTQWVGFLASAAGVYMLVKFRDTKKVKG